MVVAARDLLPDRRLQPPLRPRLASCLSLAGPGSREFPAPTTRRWEGIWHLPLAVPVPPDQDLAAELLSFTIEAYCNPCGTN